MRQISGKLMVRKPHIISRFYLAKFAAADGMLIVYEKGRQPRRSRPSNECVERDYFEFELGGKSTDNHFEQWLQIIENDVEDIYQSLLASERALTSKESSTWALFLATTFLRTRKVRNEFGKQLIDTLTTDFLSTEFIRDLQHEVAKKGRIIPAADIRAEIEKHLGEFKSQPAAGQLSGIKQSSVTLSNSL